MSLNNPVLEGLQQFNQGLQQLGQQRLLSDASNTVQQIQQSELDASKKQQALQQFGQQFALQASGLGMDPSQAFAIGGQIGPKQPLIQSKLQGMLYGTPEQQKTILENDAQEQAQAVELKRAEDDRLLKQQDIMLKHQRELAEMSNGTKLQIAQDKFQQQKEAKVDTIGKQFRNDKLLANHSTLQTQAQAFNQLLDTPNALNAATAADIFHQFVESTASREADIKRVEGAQGLINSIETTLSKYKGKDEVLPPETVRSMRAAASALSNKLSVAAGSKRQQYITDIKRHGGDPSMYDPLAFLNQPSAVTAGPAQPPQGGLNFSPGPLKITQ